MMTDTITLEGERVTLVPLTLDHVEDLWEAIDSQEVLAISTLPEWKAWKI